MHWQDFAKYLYLWFGVPSGIGRYVYLKIKPYLLVSNFDIYVQPFLVSVLAGAGAYLGKKLGDYMLKAAKAYIVKRKKKNLFKS